MEIINTYNKSIPTEGKNKIILTAILTKDGQGLHAVYIGVGSDDFILRCGLKQSYKEAITYFLGLEEKEYRK